MRERHPSPILLVLVALTALFAGPLPAQPSTPSPPSTPGEVVWWDLLTDSPGEVLDFYRQLFDWEIAEHTERHWVVLHHGQPIAGISRIRSDHPDIEEAFWLAGISVVDVDAAVDKARDLGAVVHLEPQDSPGYARFAVISDPERVPVMLLDPFRKLGGMPGAGDWVWAELWARDPDSEAAFYRQVVGYQRDRVEVAGGAYDVLSLDGRRCAGLLKTPIEKIAPAWAPYIEVKDLDATRARVAELGGSVLVEPRNLHSVGSVALVADPGGAAFFIFQRPEGAEVTR